MALVKIYTRELTVHLSEICLLYTSDLVKDIQPVTTHKSAFVYKNGMTSSYLDAEEFRKIKDYLIKKFCSDFISFKKMESMVHDLGGQFLEFTKNLFGIKFGKKNSNELIKLLDAYLISRVRFTCVQFMVLNLSNIVSDLANNIVIEKVNDEKKKEAYLSAIFNPQKKASIIKLKEDVLKTGADLGSIYREYRWMPCYDISDNPWTKKQFMEAVGGFSKEENRTLPFEEAIKGMDLSKEEEDLLRMASLVAYLRDLRDDYRRMGVYNSLGLFDEISRGIGLTRAEMAYMTMDEIYSALKGATKPNISKINERKKQFVVCFEDKGVVCKSGPDFKPIVEKLGIRLEGEYKRDTIKGVSASKGEAKGTARVVVGLTDIHKVKEGDILIAVSTHPEYLIAMKKASAFITDEGGLTSHAAIVAREMRKPCIVGTRIATKVLKDGDRVEVDANKGIIRKLKNKS